MTCRQARRFATPTLVAAMALSLLSCASDDEASNTVRSSPDDRGSEVHTESCASCHGSDLRGTDKGPSFLSIVYESDHHSDDSFRRAIATGAPQHHWPFGDMEPVEGLSRDDVEAVIAYVRGEQQRLGFDES